MRRDLSVLGSVRCLILRSRVPVTVSVPAPRSTSDHLSAAAPLDVDRCGSRPRREVTAGRRARRQTVAWLVRGQHRAFVHLDRRGVCESYHVASDIAPALGLSESAAQDRAGEPLRVAAPSGFGERAAHLLHIFGCEPCKAEMAEGGAGCRGRRPSCSCAASMPSTWLWRRDRPTIGPAM